MLVSNTIYPLCTFNLNAYCLTLLLHTAAKRSTILRSLYFCLDQEFIIVIFKKSHNDWHCLIYQPKCAIWHLKTSDSGSSHWMALSPPAKQHTRSKSQLLMLLIRPCLSLSLCSYLHSLLLSSLTTTTPNLLPFPLYYPDFTSIIR